MEQVILLGITDGKRWHYIAKKSLSRLLQKKTWNSDWNYYCMDCLYSLRAEENLWNDNDYCHMNFLRKIRKSWIIIITQSLRPQICCLKKNLDVIIIQKNLPQKKKQTSIKPVTFYYSHTVHLIAAKASTFFTEVLTAWKI